MPFSASSPLLVAFLKVGELVLFILISCRIHHPLLLPCDPTSPFQPATTFACLSFFLASTCLSHCPPRLDLLRNTPARYFFSSSCNYRSRPVRLILAAASCTTASYTPPTPRCTTDSCCNHTTILKNKNLDALLSPKHLSPPHPLGFLYPAFDFARLRKPSRHSQSSQPAYTPKPTVPDHPLSLPRCVLPRPRPFPAMSAARTGSAESLRLFLPNRCLF